MTFEPEWNKSVKVINIFSGMDRKTQIETLNQLKAKIKEETPLTLDRFKSLIIMPEFRDNIFTTGSRAYFKNSELPLSDYDFCVRSVCEENLLRVLFRFDNVSISGKNERYSSYKLTTAEFKRIDIIVLEDKEFNAWFLATQFMAKLVSYSKVMQSHYLIKKNRTDAFEKLCDIFMLSPTADIHCKDYYEFQEEN